MFSTEPKPFSNGRTFVLGTNYLYALIDNTGKILVDPIYKQVFPFNEGVAAVSYQDEKQQEAYAIIDVNGKKIKEFKRTGKEKDIIAFYSEFSEGLAVAQSGYGGTRGFIDTKGKVIIDYNFMMTLKPFSSGRAYAEKWDKKTSTKTAGFIDKKGKYVILIEKPKF